MYGKLFAQMYDGTLGTQGPWQALVTFQQFIILADREGIVDMTAEAIARRTTIPLDIIKIGISTLEQPDPHSRTPDEDGRRIVRLSDDREWGWRVINYIHYRNIRSQEERREYMRNYQRQRRAVGNRVNKSVNKVSNVNQSSKQYAVSSMQYAEAITTEGLDHSAWNTFIEYRKDIGKPYKKVSIPAAQKKLASFGADQIAVVEQTIANGWTGLFDLKRGNHGTRQQVDNSAVGKVRRANEERERRNAQPKTDGPVVGTNGQDVRAPLDE